MYKMRKLSDEESQQILKSAYESLKGIDDEDMTTAERNIFRQIVQNPSRKLHTLDRVEERILEHD